MNISNNINFRSVNNGISNKQSFSSSLRISKIENNQSSELSKSDNLLPVKDIVSLSSKSIKNVQVNPEPVSYSRKINTKSDIPVIKPSEDISNIVKDEPVSKVNVEEWQKKVRSLAISQLRSKVGQTSDNSRLGDMDGSGAITFKDISDLVKQMDEGNYDQAISLAYEGIRSRVGQSTSEDKSNEVFDLSGDGTISFADLGQLSKMLGKK
ncbi:MAG TPA: hypothetical protein PKA63_05000 [Oligoflexia bacterium]|nr:hypothetical protein [Oligoflexia bacterium]HMP48007.1 hypothetical protein [Oligoflexia bacterium]